MKPNFVTAAGESSGLYVSRDAGDTWTYAALKGERVTALRFCEDPRGNEVLLVGTFADSEFRALGLGEPHTKANDRARVHWVTVSDNQVGSRKFLDAGDFGVTNVGFGVDEGFLNIAATRGVYHRWPHGIEFGQKRQYMPGDTLNVAFGHRRFITTERNGDKKLNIAGYTAPFSSPAVPASAKAASRATNADGNG